MWLGLVYIIRLVLSLYGYLLIAAAVITWIPGLNESELGYIVRRLTDPYLNLFRRFIPSVNLGGILLDLGFLVGVIVYFMLVNSIIMPTLFRVL